MSVLVDTSVWSLALRRSAVADDAVVVELRNLIADNRAQLIGPIRQEILSGVREPQQFERLREHLAAFPDLPLFEDDYVQASRYFNACRAKGILGSNTDFLIAAVSADRRMPIFTTDRDFDRYQAILPIQLHPP